MATEQVNAIEGDNAGTAALSDDGPSSCPKEQDDRAITPARNDFAIACPRSAPRPPPTPELHPAPRTGIPIPAASAGDLISAGTIVASIWHSRTNLPG
jgi:hypothetical protein